MQAAGCLSKGVSMRLSRMIVLSTLAAAIFMGGLLILPLASPLASGVAGINAGTINRDVAGPPSFATPCRDIPVFKEDVIGFSINKPTGWHIRYTTGVISILKDPQGREGVLIYPVRPKSGFSLDQFLSSYLNVLKKSPTPSSRIDYSEFSSTRERAQASLTGWMGGTPVRGLAAAHVSGTDYVCKLYWAPVDLFASEQGLLKCLADSYQRTEGQVLVRLRGSYFETMAPMGWKIQEESSNSVNFTNGARDAGVMSTYMDFGSDPQPMTIPRLFEAVTKPCPPGQQPCFSITRTYARLAAIDAPDFRDNLGRAWKARAEEFEATLIDGSGRKVHGVLTGMVMNGRHVTGLYGWVIATATRISRPDTWERNSAATAIVQENLKIIKASELITQRILPRNNPYDSSTIMGHWAYKNRVNEELSGKRQEAIMGYEPYRTPTGERIDVPLNSIPGGNNPIYWNPQTQTIWNSTLQPPPAGYQQLKPGIGP